MHLVCVNVKRHTDHRLIKWDACPRNHKLQNDQKQNWLHKVEEDIILVTRLVQVESLLNVHCIVCVLNQHQLQTTAPHKPFCCSRKSSFPLNRCMMLRHKHMHHGFPNLNPHLFVCLTVFCRFKHQWLFINVSFENSKIHSQNVIVLSKQY